MNYGYIEMSFTEGEECGSCGAIFEKSIHEYLKGAFKDAFSEGEEYEYGLAGIQWLITLIELPMMEMRSLNKRFSSEAHKYIPRRSKTWRLAGR